MNFPLLPHGHPLSASLQFSEKLAENIATTSKPYSLTQYIGINQSLDLGRSLQRFDLRKEIFIVVPHQSPYDDPIQTKEQDTIRIVSKLVSPKIPRLIRANNLIGLIDQHVKRF